MITICRGLPGSGKSTWAASQPDAAVLCADDYHLVRQPSGELAYKFDPSKAGFAHADCLRRYIEAVQQSNQRKKFAHANIIVANTNTTLHELAPYVQVACAYNQPYEIRYFLCDVQAALKRNIHGVPSSTILAMNRNLQAEIVPPYWTQAIHTGA